ncbi:gliding motility-associated ABC transporter ATP-binding subunit GldA [Pseudoalteromonas sp. A25]|uniref:ABC transporter ATP-binding protein n=1 Tax=Pseudoalteromonas sp. A25 TaxID=116092 RepID=UPI001260D6FC|nr:ATP-binding cassette domain-containing protein [Pseudoalteromonas sp. A25]BBN82542.1 gliding motility-associated ABC transporter ATP-binding subunit GldA [Pseudoalteromonas sp. A25]
MLNVSHLTRSYGSFKAVDDVSFTIKQGEIIGLLGHNGAGKTTIMKMISGYLESDTGCVSLNGITLKDNPKQLQRQLGYLPESLPVYPDMTVAEYLDYAATLKGLTGNEKRSELKRAIAATDIRAKLLAPIHTLSRGYKQRVGVAQAILGKPKLLILDEPTNGLDPEQTQHMRKLIKDIAKHATVILSTHIMQEVNAICDRVLILKSGQLVLDEKLTALNNAQHLLVETNCENETVFNAIEGIRGATKRAEHYWQLDLEDTTEIKTVACRVSKTLIENSFALYALHSEKRDLETLFNDINNNGLSSTKGGAHAA